MKTINITTANMFKLASLTKVELSVLISLIEIAQKSPSNPCEAEIILNSSSKRRITSKLDIAMSTLNNTLTKITKSGYINRNDIGIYTISKGLLNIIETNSI